MDHPVSVLVLLLLALLHFAALQARAFLVLHGTIILFPLSFSAELLFCPTPPPPPPTEQIQSQLKLHLPSLPLTLPWWCSQPRLGRSPHWIVIKRSEFKAPVEELTMLLILVPGTWPQGTMMWWCCSSVDFVPPVATVSGCSSSSRAPSSAPDPRKLKVS